MGATAKGLHLPHASLNIIIYETMDCKSMKVIHKNLWNYFHKSMIYIEIAWLRSAKIALETSFISWENPVHRRINRGISIPRDALQIGMLVHMYGTDFGCVWQIIGFEHESNGELWLRLQTPVSRKLSRGRASRARYIRAQQPDRR